MIRKTVEGREYESQMVGELHFDQTPKEGSFNPVTSDAVVKAIDEAKEDMQEKIDEVTLDPSAVAFGNVHLLDEVTEFAADAGVLVDSETNGPGFMESDTLLELTAQNALAGNVAPEFIPNSTTTIVNYPYVYKDSLYVAKEIYQGPWDASKFQKASIMDIMPAVAASSYDYAVCDKDGNAVLVLKDGHIHTKYFTSVGTPKTASLSSLFDFVISDDDGNVILGLYDGHIITKNFDSKNLDVFKSSKNYGKSVGVFGGSLSVFPESQATKNLWRKYLKLDITDYGVGGAGFSSLQGITPIQTQVDGAAKKDIYILWASTNDYTNSRQIGEYSDYTYLDSYDSGKLTTQCGGINYCIKKLYEKNPLCEIYFFTGIDFFSQEGGYNPFTEQTNAIGKTYQEYVDAQKKCCEFFSIPVLDQNAISGLNIFNYTNYFKNDNLHMKEIGYQKIAMQQVQFLANGL